MLIGCGGPMDGPGADDPASDPSADGSGNRDGTTQPGGNVPAPGTPTEPTEPTPPPAPDTSVSLGTAYQVKAIQPPGDYLPRLAPRPTSLVGLGSTLFFSIDSDGAIGGLWKSDGTEAGTVQVQTTRGGVWEVLPVGGRLFFNGADAASGRELWVTDGTAAGTRLVKDVTPGTTGSGLANFAALGDTLLFFRYVPGPSDEDPGRYELWRSDGTEANTRLVVDLGADVSLTNFWRTVGSTLFFSLRDPVHGTELWKTDGTPEGTGLVRDIAPGAADSWPSDFQVVGSSLFFLTTSTHQVWRTDGSEAGTQPVFTWPTTQDSAHLSAGTNGNVFFSRSSTETQLLSLSSLEVDSAGGVQERAIATLPNPYANQADALPYIDTATVAGGKLFFSLTITSPGPAPRDVQLWVTDGTEAGTTQVMRPLSLSDEFASTLFTLDERILYSAPQSGRGIELWVSDGTPAGTGLAQDIDPGESGSYPADFVRVGSRVFFTAYTQEASAMQLWALPLED
ncbi:hypothetical protein I3V78_33550 [Archangium primigenium]|nr:hypothetical protein [Archangium primigenium]